MRFYNQKWVGWFDVGAVATWPVLWFRDSEDEVPASLVLHENVHLKQQLRYLLVGFYVLYVFYYIRNRLRGMDHLAAYWHIPFEQEARRTWPGG